MASRSRHLLVELAQLPRWVGVGLSAVAYVILRWMVPALTPPAHPVLFALAQTASTHAWIAFVFLLPLPFSLANTARQRRLIASQKSIDALRSMPWDDFEQLVGEAYRQSGYRVVVRGGRASDGGVDLELRTNDKTLVVQCKRWKTRTVGVDLVRELYGSMAGEEAHGAIFVTSGRYTPDAIDFARDKPMKLVDGSGLLELLKVVQRGACSRPAESPMVTVAERAVTCPQCGSAMVRRVAKQGAKAGNAFWGCSRFPACRGTRTVART